MRTFCPTFPIQTNRFRWKTYFSDGIGKIIFVTPSKVSKITGDRDAKEYRRSVEYQRRQKCWYPWLSTYGTKSYKVHRNPMESIRVQRNYCKSSGKPNLRQVQGQGNMPRSYSPKAKQLTLSADDLQWLTALYVYKYSKRDIWLNMPRF